MDPTNDSLTLSRADLEHWLGLALDTAFEDESSYTFRHNYFWDLPAGKEIFDSDADVVPSLAQVSADLESLRELSEEPGAAFWWHLVVASRVLGVLGREQLA